MINDWWQARTARERWFLAGLCLVAVIALAWAVVLPWQQSQSAKRAELATTRLRVHSAQKIALSINHLRHAGAKTVHRPPTAFAPWLKNRLRQTQLERFLTHFSESKQHHVTLTWESVPFDALATWVTTINRQDNVSILRWKISKAPHVGTVYATLVLTNP